MSACSSNEGMLVWWVLVGLFCGFFFLHSYCDYLIYTVFSVVVWSQVIYIPELGYEK